MNQCPYCKKKIAMSKAFCSKKHKELYFESCSITISKPFTKRLVFFMNLKEREAELKKFATRHKISNEVIFKKYNEATHLFFPNETHELARP